MKNNFISFFSCHIFVQAAYNIYIPTLLEETSKFDISFLKWYNIVVAFKGGNEKFMKNDDKASISLKKIVCISIILIFLLSIGVMAGNVKVNNVKIVLSSGYEMDVITTKTSIKEILEENHIVLLENEKVVPSEDEELSDNKTIIITKDLDAVEIATEVESSKNITAEDVLQNYSTIVEKIVTEEVEIPYETIKKNVSKSSGTKINQVVQNGVNGIKEVTYKVKYQNEKEIEKIEISSKVIKKPIDKIIEVRTKQQVTSRGTSSSTKVRYGGKWSYTAEELDLLCAITAQECNTSYEGALAVITCAANRAESKKWKHNGTDPLSQYKAKNQFCYSIDNHWKKRLNGNYPSYVKQAVIDALNGKRNHNYLSFRAAGYARGVNIGGNVYFNAM